MKPKRIALLLTLIAFALRMHGLSFQPLWGDEGWSVYFATMPWPDMIVLTALDIHPPLYYALLHGCFAVVGPGAELARFLSVVIGTLMIPAMYALGRRLIPAPMQTGGRQSGWGGVAAAAVVTVAPMAVYYSQEVRLYGLVTLLGMLSTLFFVDAFVGNPPRLVAPSESLPPLVPAGGVGGGRNASRTSAWLYILTTTLALYTMYYAAFIVAFQIAYILFTSSQKGETGKREKIPPSPNPFLKRGGLFFKSLLAIAALYLPWIIYAGAKLLSYVQNKADVEGYVSLNLPQFFAGYLLAFSLGHPSEKLHLYAAPAGWLFALIALTGAWYLWRQNKRRMTGVRPPAPPSAGSGQALPLLYLLVPLILGWLINLINPFTPPYFQRTLLIAAPAWWLLVAAGLVWLWSKQRVLMTAAAGLLLAINLMGLADFYTFPRYQAEDYRPLLAEVAARATPDDTLLASYQWQLGYYHAYLPPSGPRLYAVPDWGFAWGTDAAAMKRDLSNLLTDGAVWFPAHQAAGHIWEDQAEAMMAEIGYPALLQWANPHTKLSLIAPNTPTEPGPIVNFQGELQAQIALPLAAEFESGRGIIPIEIIWTALNDLNQDPLITLKLVDAQGEIWAKRDTHPRAGQFYFSEMSAGEHLTDRHGLLISAGTPPGEYKLRLSLTDPGTERPLSVLDESGQPQGAEAILMSVDVVPARRPVGVEALAVQSPQDITFDNHLKLVGYSVGASVVKTGDTLPVNLFWQGLRNNLPNLTTFVQLQDEAGQAVALTERPPVYPTTDWQAGTLLRDLHRVKIPASLPAGNYKLAGGVLLPDKTRLATSSGDQVILGKIIIQERPHAFAPPSPHYPMEVNFSGGAALIGYDLAPQTLKPGQSLTLTLYWRGEAGFDKSWAVFTHLVDANGRIVAQRDQFPGDGAFPTTGWISDEYITDTRHIIIEPDTPLGMYVIEVGLYNPHNFERVTVGGGGDVIKLDMPVSIIED